MICAQPRMATSDAATEDEMEAFFHQIVDQAQLRSVRRFTTGSTVEVPLIKSSLLYYKLDPDSVDMDTMFYDINRYVIPRCKSVPEGYNGTVLRICTVGMHAGYARLLDKKSGIELQHDKMQLTFGHDESELTDPPSNSIAQFFLNDV